jgi:hypothetical protein
MREKSIAQLAFALFLMTTATLFLRPAELFPLLVDLPIYEYLILLTLALAFQSFTGHFRHFMLVRQPVTLCVVGVLVAIAISHLQYVYLGGVLDSSTYFLKTVIYYGLLITTVNTPSRLRLFLLTVALCTSTMVALTVLDYHDILDFEFIQQLNDKAGYTDEGEIIFVKRIRGTGIFQDPNDMASVICAAGVLCTYFLTTSSLGKLRLMWLVPMAVLLIGLLDTKSCGGLLACGAAGLTLLSVRFGGRIAIACGLMAACLVPFLAGRQAEISLDEEGTGGERLMLWREGLEELKSAAILFGTGQGSYADIAGLVAHNSFVHSYVELGLFGGTMFFGCFFFAGMQLYPMGRLHEPILNPELVRMRPFICALLAGWCMSIFSLSRSYIVPTYMLIGTAVAYLNLVWIHTPSGEPLVIWSKLHAWRLAVASATAFTGLYVFTAIMTR